MAQRLANYPVHRDTQGEKTNPDTTIVMADTGAIPAGIYEVLVSVSETALAEYAVQRRNVANDANIGDVVVFYGPANSGRDVPLRFEIEKDERVRVMMNASLTGDAVVHVTAQRVG